MDELLFTLTNPQFLFALFSAIAVAATAFTVAVPLLARNDLNSRKKRMAVERAEIRARERAALARDSKQGQRPSLRTHPKEYMQNIVERFELKQKLLADGTRDKLAQAGERGEAAVIRYVFSRVVVPAALFLFAIVYLFGVDKFDQPAVVRLLIALGIGGAGFYLPNVLLHNRIQKRQTSIRRAWPDALDLMLICVESGMSLEQAFKKVADEVAVQSIPLAEELALCNAELSYLNNRRKAYENLGRRTGLEQVKAVMTSLIQADTYGTPVGQALRVLAQESRDMRMAEAEKKAAGLPPKLTVPMIVFFLPCLFIVIIGPAAMQVMALD
ncbi:MAG: type II secretion system F family protein [Devosiaceae bacterium]|nr:type II secretion system F family protein [Devosiaceae bacterium MH13]